MLDVDAQEAKPSHVFNRVTRTNVVNKHLRSSSKIEYRDEKLFDWLETHVVKTLNTKINSFYFNLVRNDVEVVKYNEGDFFRKHQDYINFDSNEFRNYTFLMCLRACEQGGETILHENPTASGEEQQQVLSGQKILLKGNLLCFRDTTPKDYIIIELAKANDEPWVISVELLQCAAPTYSYMAFYHFEKQRKPENHTFLYRESELTAFQFSLFYQRVMACTTQLKQVIQSLDYLGLTRNRKVVRKFLKWLNNTDGEDSLIL